MCRGHFKDTCVYPCAKGYYYDTKPGLRTCGRDGRFRGASCQPIACTSGAFRPAFASRPVLASTPRATPSPLQDVLLMCS